MANPQVSVIMGSVSDHPTLQHAAELLTNFEISHEVKVVSAHRTPQRLVSYTEGLAERGIQVVIAGAGGAAHLPGMVAAMTEIPVLGVPVQSKTLGGVDSLLSIVQMPAGVPVATLAIGPSGAKNAALLAASILALSDQRVAEVLRAFRRKQTEGVALEP